MVRPAAPFDVSAQTFAQRFPEIARAVQLHGVPRLPRRHSSAFAALAWAITSQQLATAAAASIWRRTQALVHGRMTASTIGAQSESALLGAGQSRAKVAALQDLAARCENGLRLGTLWRKPDDEVIAELISVKGIGVWSAQMFLFFHLYRPDVWPTGDLAVRRGYGALFDVDTPTAKALEPLGEKFKGHRSTLAWYCWRSS